MVGGGGGGGVKPDWPEYRGFCISCNRFPRLQPLRLLT